MILEEGREKHVHDYSLARTILLEKLLPPGADCEKGGNWELGLAIHLVDFVDMGRHTAQVIRRDREPLYEANY